MDRTENRGESKFDPAASFLPVINYIFGYHGGNRMSFRQEQECVWESGSVHPFAVAKSSRKRRESIN